MAKKKKPEAVIENTIVFEGFLPKIDFDDNKDELPFVFRLHDPQDQLKQLADLTDDPKGVLATLKSLLKHNGKLTVKIEKKGMRAVYRDATDPQEPEIVTGEGIRPVGIILESFIIDKKCKAAVVYKAPKDLAQHNKLTKHAGHKLLLELSQPQSELFEKEE